MLQSMLWTGQTTAKIFNFFPRASLEQAGDIGEYPYVRDGNEMVKGLETTSCEEEWKKQP